MKLLSPEQQLKEKRPGMPENLKRICEQQIRDIPQIPFEPERKHVNYSRAISLQKTPSHWLPLEQTKNQVRKGKQACFKG